jgi:hypothetical protein
MDVNKKVDAQVNFAQLEDCFKVNTENNNTALVTKAKTTTVSINYFVKNVFIFLTHLQILPCNRSIAINVFLKKFHFNDAQSFVQALQDSKSNLNSECLRMLVKVLPSADEVNKTSISSCNF